MRRRIKRTTTVAGCRIKIVGNDPVHVDSITRLVRSATEGYGFFAELKPTGGCRPIPADEGPVTVIKLGPHTCPGAPARDYATGTVVRCNTCGAYSRVITGPMGGSHFWTSASPRWMRKHGIRTDDPEDCRGLGY